MKTSKSVLAIFGAGFILAAPLQAQFINIFTPDSHAEFNVTANGKLADGGNSENSTQVKVGGSFAWDSTNFYLRVVMDNLSDNNGVLSGFGFNTPNLDNAVSLVEQTKPGAFSIEQAYELNANWKQPLGVSANPPAGGSPNTNSITAGNTGIFDFDLSAAFIDQNTIDFSYAGFFGGNSDDFDIIFRMQSIDGQIGSDMFGGFISDTPMTPVPEPSTYGIAGACALALMILIRRTQQRKS